MNVQVTISTKVILLQRRIAILLLVLSIALSGCLIMSLAIAEATTDSAEFSLLTGEGVEVCGAYLKRLNQTEFEQPPYCDRPEVEGMANFETLKRVYLTAEEIWKIYDRVLSFDLTNNQMYSEKVRMKSYLYPDKKRSLQHIASEIALRRLKVWRYEPMVDIDNDGKGDNVVVWHTSYGGPCRSGAKYMPKNLIYIFDKRLKYIDVKKTTKVFGGTEKWKYSDFRFIENQGEFGVFVYNNGAYFDAFPYGMTFGSDKRHNVDLRVYKHAEQKSTAICEYHWNRREQ